MKRFPIVFSLLLCPIFLFSACSTGTSSNLSGTYHLINAQEAKQMIDKNEGVLIDVRTKEEYAQAHIPGAILIQNETITDKKPEKLPDLSVPILVYCRSGRRSKDAAQKLVQMGYQNVYDFGGIIDWPYETTTEDDTSDK